MEVQILLPGQPKKTSEKGQGKKDRTQYPKWPATCPHGTAKWPQLHRLHSGREALGWFTKPRTAQGSWTDLPSGSEALGWDLPDAGFCWEQSSLAGPQVWEQEQRPPRSWNKDRDSGVQPRTGPECPYRNSLSAPTSPLLLLVLARPPEVVRGLQAACPGDACLPEGHTGHRASTQMTLCLPVRDAGVDSQQPWEQPADLPLKFRPDKPPPFT